MKYDHLLEDILNQNELTKINDKVYLTRYQMEVLKKYNIPYESCGSIGEIIFYIEEILNEDTNDFEDLESVSSALAESDYYQNYKK